MNKFEKLYKQIINESYENSTNRYNNIFSEEYDNSNWYDQEMVTYIRNKVEDGAKAGKKFIVVSGNELKEKFQTISLRGFEAIRFFMTDKVRPIACKNFLDIKKGEIGGYIPNENVLSQSGDCWIEYNVRIDGSNSLITDNVQITDGWYQGNIKVSGNIQLFNKVQMWGNIIIDGDGRIDKYIGTESYIRP